MNNADCVSVSKAFIEKLAGRKQFFAKEDAEVRRALVGVYDLQNKLYEAILVLKDIVYDGDSYEEKISDWLDIAAYWFEERDAASAESYVNKIMHVIHHSPNPEHILRYRMAYAKV